MTCNNLCKGEKKENVKLASFGGGNELYKKNELIGKSKAAHMKAESLALCKGSLIHIGHQE